MVRAWAKVNERLPQFVIEAPVSGAFKAFLGQKKYIDTSHVENLESVLVSN